MKRVLFLLVFYGTILPTNSQSVVEYRISNSQAVFDVNALLDHVKAERVRAEAFYATEEAACYDLFAVMDCLKEIRVKRRASLNELRRQELQIHDAERMQQGEAQLNSIREKFLRSRESRSQRF